jgi:hypothetical protein
MLSAALAVHALMFPLIRRQRFQKREVGISQRAVLLERRFQFTFVVVKRRNPRILIEAGNLRPRRTKNRANPVTADKLTIGNMRHNFGD